MAIYLTERAETLKTSTLQRRLSSVSLARQASGQGNVQTTAQWDRRGDRRLTANFRRKC
jgi:hypothetical protein